VIFIRHPIVFTATTDPEHGNLFSIRGVGFASATLKFGGSSLSRLGGGDYQFTCVDLLNEYQRKQ